MESFNIVKAENINFLNNNPSIPLDISQLHLPNYFVVDLLSYGSTQAGLSVFLEYENRNEKIVTGLL